MQRKLEEPFSLSLYREMEGKTGRKRERGSQRKRRGEKEMRERERQRQKEKKKKKEKEKRDRKKRDRKREEERGALRVRVIDWRTFLTQPCDIQFERKKRER